MATLQSTDGVDPYAIVVFQVGMSESCGAYRSRELLEER